MTKTIRTAACLSLLIPMAHGGTINFSGRDWTTNEPSANTHGTTPQYAVNGAESGTATGAWDLWAGMWTPVSLNVGDTVSYDFYMTKELRNTWGGGDSDYIGDAWAGFLGPNAGGTLDPPTFAWQTMARNIYGNDASALSIQTTSNTAAGTTPLTGIHFEWSFTSATDFTLDVTDIATGTPIATGWTGSWAGTKTGGEPYTLADVQLFAAGAWNTEQDVTIENFTVAGHVVPDHFDRPGSAAVALDAALGSGLTSTFGIGDTTDMVTITTVDGLSASSTHTINIVPLPGITPGTYTLIDYDGIFGGDGYAALQLGPLPHIDAILVNNTTNGSVDLQVNSVSDLFWDGDAGTSDWDTGSTANWQVSEQFLAFDSVIFDDTATVPGGTVNVVGTVEPREVTFENNTTDYTLAGGAVASPGGLQKLADGDLILLNDNTFAGESFIDAGTLRIGNGGTSGSLQGAMDLLSGISVVYDRSDSFTVNPAGSGQAIGGGGAVEFSGSGEMTLGDRNTFTGGLTIQSGSVKLDAPGDSGTGTVRGEVTVAAGATLEAAGNNALGWEAGSKVDTIHLNGGTLELSGPGDNGWGIVVNLADGATISNVGSSYMSLGDSSTINVTGDSTCTLSSRLQLREGSADTEFNVADGAAGIDLLVSGELFNKTYLGDLLAHGFTKSGDGTMALSAVNTYIGNTTVEAGTLSLAEDYLADEADVVLSTGTALNLQHAQTDVIDELIIDGVVQLAGIWGATTSSADHKTALITGTGLLSVTTGPAGYVGWAGGFPGFFNTDAEFDFEGDGLPSGIEWVVGGDPTLNDAATVAPTFDNTSDPNDFLFTFRRSDLAAADPNTTIVVEYGSDLVGWHNSADDGVADGVTITEVPNDFGPGIDRVTVAIPRSLFAGGRLFARLKVVVN